MPNLFLLFSHTITVEQGVQARTELGVDNIVVPPQNIRHLWATVPSADEFLTPFLEPIVSWLDKNAEKGDFVLIQGDFGASFLLVQHACKKEYIPIYSTTERKIVEKKIDNDAIQLTHTFRHVRFRIYGQ